MADSEAGAVSSIYAGLNVQNEFIAFWKRDDNTIVFFMPHDLRARYYVVSINDWPTIRDSYNQRDTDFHLHDDIVNAAWHFIGQKMIWLRKSSFAISLMPPGNFYRRIWRGRYLKNDLTTCNLIDPLKIYGNDFTQSVVAASSLFNSLIDLFRYIEPSTDNLNAYGHKVREVLILVCTEIESGWRAVLDNNIRSKKTEYNTTDYIRVKAPLHLDKWTLMLKDYPDLGEFVPFEHWDHAAPTKSLGWYSAYNATKHHREAEFTKATLGCLLSAMAALHVIQAAQWGPEIFSRFHGNRFSPFYIVQCPEYEPTQLYIPSLDGNDRLEPALYFDR